MQWLASVLCAVALVAAASTGAARKRRPTGMLRLSAQVAGAKVTIDGRRVGTTPLKPTALREGTHTIAVSKLGFLDFVQRIQIKAGKTTTAIADLLPFSGVIKVTTTVRRAIVLVDGTSVGKAPLEREIGVGKHVITVRAPGFLDYIEEIKTGPGRHHSIHANLASSGRGEQASAEPALVPLVTSVDRDTIDDLALEPLAPAGGGEDLALAPLPVPGSRTLEADDDLALEALPIVSSPPAEEVAAMDALMMPSGPGVGVALEPTTPWYLEWWALTTAAVVVVAGVSVGVYYATSGGRADELQGDCWQPGDAFETCTMPAIVSF